jgi:hypothetical protein
MKTKAQLLNITDFPYRERDKDNNQTYFEASNGWWGKYEYDEFGNEIYYEGSDGDWRKKEWDEYNNNSRITYYEHSSGHWCKREYYENELIEYEDYNGNYWKEGYTNKCPFIYENLTI